MVIKYIEELSMNAWPSLETMHYDGWVIRFANGYTKRANSVYPLYASEIDVHTKIAKCEKLFMTKNLHTVFKITHTSTPLELDDALYERGYKIIDPTSVQTLNLSSVPEPTLRDIYLSNHPDEQWLSDYCRLTNFKSSNFNTLTQMLQSIIPQKCFISLKVDGKTATCGLGVIENEHIGIFNLVVDRNYRYRGYGEQTVLNILRLGKLSGAKTAYLQVVIENYAAMRLYSKLGFKEMYKYWYRTKL